jgi:hypothetical protein
MKIKLETDIYKLMHDMSSEEIKTLAFELVTRWGHDRKCNSLSASKPFEDGTVIVGPNIDDNGNQVPCSCGADERLAKCFEYTFSVHRRD